jgi:hypothetical protein
MEGKKGVNSTRASSEVRIPDGSPAASVSNLSKEPRSPQPFRANAKGPQITASTRSQAIVIVDPAQPPLQDGSSPLPPGWNWVLANSSVPRLFERVLSEANLHWSATLVPEEHGDAIPPNDATLDLPSALFTYDEQIKIPSQLIPQGQYPSRVHLVIINGHQLPLCDFRQAIRLHRRNRSDVTVLELCESHPHGYDEQLLLDEDGQVHRVTRIYRQSSDRPLENERGWPAVMVLSAGAMMRLADQPMPRQLNLWPAVMLRAGLHLRGHPIAGRCYDLHTPHHAHELAEAILNSPAVAD